MCFGVIIIYRTNHKKMCFQFQNLPQFLQGHIWQTKSCMKTNLQFSNSLLIGDSVYVKTFCKKCQEKFVLILKRDFSRASKRLLTLPSHMEYQVLKLMEVATKSPICFVKCHNLIIISRLITWTVALELSGSLIRPRRLFLRHIR